MQQSSNYWKRYFLRGPCQGYMRRTSSHYEKVLRPELEEQEFDVRRPPACEEMSPGAEEHPSLEDVTKQRMKFMTEKTCFA